MHSIDTKKGKTRHMAIKVDIEKAYDRLEWNFIHKVLQAFHFLKQLNQAYNELHLIHKYIHRL